ncbi:twin-arginine translocase TatA/TatE family subunit [Microbacterium xanthum]|uniref:twin-arginine translocase TatA/TatE family subunit n=1 Tax=Microbacterium xanthum TaxID=3079794 RepID=UPI002AD53B21|nr:MULTISPECIES: twin-arginine translocase TatA/TatE family subunit [unclassified Microbacterium]MDZ8172682.1 twin-arginine translocase TatA/TatE family subunit [Microbacterium sp. KSW-48]MDZ8202481.1 twin-arginine translocase TatA/TatE family subunit [Microbacterium sp. SSW1-59]
MANAFSPWHLLLILAVILLLFGAAKLPALAKSVGQSARVFRGEMKAMKDEDAPQAADRADTTSSTTESSSSPNAGGASDPKP